MGRLFNDDEFLRLLFIIRLDSRRQMLVRLGRSAATAPALARSTGCPVSTVRSSLRVMEEAGLIRRMKDGRLQRCSFDPASIATARRWIEMHQRFWTEQLDSLAAYLEGPGRDGDGEKSPEARGETR